MTEHSRSVLAERAATGRVCAQSTWNAFHYRAACGQWPGSSGGRRRGVGVQAPGRKPCVSKGYASWHPLPLQASSSTDSCQPTNPPWDGLDSPHLADGTHRQGMDLPKATQLHVVGPGFKSHRHQPILRMGKLRLGWARRSVLSASGHTARMRLSWAGSLAFALLSPALDSPASQGEASGRAEEEAGWEGRRRQQAGSLPPAPIPASHTRRLGGAGSWRRQLLPPPPSPCPSAPVLGSGCTSGSCLGAAPDPPLLPGLGIPRGHSAAGRTGPDAPTSLSHALGAAAVPAPAPAHGPGPEPPPPLCRASGRRARGSTIPTTNVSCLANVPEGYPCRPSCGLM